MNFLNSLLIGTLSGVGGPWTAALWGQRDGVGAGRAGAWMPHTEGTGRVWVRIPGPEDHSGAWVHDERNAFCSRKAVCRPLQVMG